MVTLLQPLLTQTSKIRVPTSPSLLFRLLYCWRVLVFHQKRLSSLQLSDFPSAVPLPRSSAAAEVGAEAQPAPARSPAAAGADTSCAAQRCPEPRGIVPEWVLGDGLSF